MYLSKGQALYGNRSESIATCQSHNTRIETRDVKSRNPNTLSIDEENGPPVQLNNHTTIKVPKKKLSRRQDNSTTPPGEGKTATDIDPKDNFTISVMAQPSVLFLYGDDWITAYVAPFDVFDVLLIAPKGPLKVWSLLYENGTLGSQTLEGVRKAMKYVYPDTHYYFNAYPYSPEPNKTRASLLYARLEMLDDLDVTCALCPRLSNSTTLPRRASNGHGACVNPQTPQKAMKMSEG